MTDKSSDGSGGENDNSFRFAGPQLRPIHIAYDPRLLSLTYETLGFDYFEIGTQATGHSGLATKEGDHWSSGRNGYGNYLPFVTTGKGYGAFGVTPEARPITFTILSTLICFRLLPKNSMYQFVTRLQTLKDRYSNLTGIHLTTPHAVVANDAGLCNGQWDTVLDLLWGAYGTDYDAVTISTRKELYEYPWALFDAEFIAVWRAIQSGNAMGNFPTEEQWNSSVDSTTSLLKGIGTDAHLVLDGSNALVNAVCAVPGTKVNVCNATPVGRLTAATKAADAVAPYASQLTDALSSQAKGAYGAFAGIHKERTLKRYVLDYNRRRYLHRNFAGFAGTIPKAISLIVPATIAAGRANDPLVADPVVMNPYVFVMPDPTMAPGAPPR